MRIAQSDLRGAKVEITHDGRLRDIDSAQFPGLLFDRLQPMRISKAYSGRKN